MRTRSIVAAGLATAAITAGGAAGAAGPPAVCEGTVSLISMELQSTHVRPARTLTEFTYVSLHDFCPQPGVLDVAVQRGRLWFDLDSNGVGTVRFTSIVEYEGDTLQGDGTGRVSATGISGHVRAFGGTGDLAGISGTGTFWSTGPTTFADEIAYVYP